MAICVYLKLARDSIGEWESEYFFFSWVSAVSDIPLYFLCLWDSGVERGERLGALNLASSNQWILHSRCLSYQIKCPNKLQPEW